jgi:hypothetical protein
VIRIASNRFEEKCIKRFGSEKKKLVVPNATDLFGVMDIRRICNRSKRSERYKEPT